MSLTRKRRRSSLWNDHVGNAGANDLVCRQRQAGRTEHKQTIRHGLLQLQSHSCLSIAEIVSRHFALSRKFKSHQRCEGCWQLDGKLIGRSAVDLPVESQRDLGGRFGDVGDRDGFTDQRRNSLSQFDSERARANRTALEGQRRSCQRDFSITSMSRCRRLHGPVGSITDSTFISRVF